MVELKKIHDYGYEEITISDFSYDVVNKGFVSITDEKKFWVFKSQRTESKYFWGVFKDRRAMLFMYSKVAKYLKIKRVGTDLKYENIASLKDPENRLRVEIFIKIHRDTLEMIRTTQSFGTNNLYKLVAEEQELYTSFVAIYCKKTGAYKLKTSNYGFLDSDLDEMYREIYYKRSLNQHINGTAACEYPELNLCDLKYSV